MKDSTFPDVGFVVILGNVSINLLRNKIMIGFIRATKALCIVLCFAVGIFTLSGCSGSWSSTPKTFEGGGPIPEFKGEETSTKNVSAKKK
jgi:hypothetical protein